MSKENGEESDRKVKILESKIKSVLFGEGKKPSKENIYVSALSVFKESLGRNNEYIEESIRIMNLNAPETLGELSDEVRELLKKYVSLTTYKNWEVKDVYSLLLKSVFTEDAYGDSEVIDLIIDLSLSSSPKIRKRAFPALRRVIEHEDKKNGSSKTFQRLMQMVEALSEKDHEHSGKIISILSNLTEEISRYNLTDRMLDICKSMIEASETLSISAICFARTILSSSSDKKLNTHLYLLTEALKKDKKLVEDTVILLEYSAEIFRTSVLDTVKGKENFLLLEEGSEIDQLLKNLIKNERKENEKLPLEICLSLHSLIKSLGTYIFPYFKKLIVAVAFYCHSANDLRISKEIELIIGNIGIEKYLKAINGQEFYFWLPMIKSSVHSTDLSFFFTKFIPFIQKEKNNDIKTEYEALWSCFPSFCRNTSDHGNVLRKLIDTFYGHLQMPSVRGYICLGIHTLVEESLKSIASGTLSTEEVLSRTKILKEIGEATGLFEKLVFRFTKDPTENERVCIRSMLHAIDSQWQIDYFNGIIEKSFIDAIIPNTELKPEINRKENDIPEHERIFVEHAPLLEIVASGLVGNQKVEEGLLKYCLSTHLRPQKMAYKVLLCLIRNGYSSSALIEFFLAPQVEQVLFLCSRHLRVEILYELSKIHGIRNGDLICRLIFEAIKIVRLEGGRNRKTAFDTITEISVMYTNEELSEVWKMACAGIPNGLADYQAGAICILTSIMYNGKEKIEIENIDMAFEMIENLSSEKKYATSKALLGFLSVLFTETPHIDRYVERALICIDRVIYHFKPKLHENLKLLLRKVLDVRDVKSKLSYPQKELLAHKAKSSRVEERNRVTTKDGKLFIKERETLQRKQTRPGQHIRNAQRKQHHQ
ncbi:hypothetical protein NEFER01_0134 [Nematocida sp. LUAm1]|nr:hypothetical protein NEFER02_0104 [Nematocida sp. LUAm2]KAI5176809.1 hypothetical protein NEFER01_0134 [Nematocida sp. LUAm1]